MKRLSLAMVLLLMMVSLTAYAGNGKGNHKQEKNMVCLTDLTTLLISGKVVDVGYRDGIVVDTGSNSVNIYGMGPEWYWEAKNVDRPDIGDSIDALCYMVTFSDGTTRYVAQSMTIGTETIELRDSKTGCPLWRGPQKR